MVDKVLAAAIVVALMAIFAPSAPAQTPSPSPSPTPSPTDAAPPPECSDGADNDNDGATDFPADGGCDSELDNTELTETPRSPSVVTIRYDRGSARFVGDVDSSLSACESRRAVILRKARPGADRAVWHASTTPRGLWRSRGFSSTPKGRFYAVVVETYVPVESGYAACLRDRSSDTSPRGSSGTTAFALGDPQQPRHERGELFTSRFSSSITIRYRPRRGWFEGAVANPREDCVSHVAVILRRARLGSDRTIWRASSNTRGTWRSERFPNAEGRFYALVKVTYPFATSDAVLRCEGDRSVTISVGR